MWKSKYVSHFSVGAYGFQQFTFTPSLSLSLCPHTQSYYNNNEKEKNGLNFLLVAKLFAAVETIGNY